MRRIILIVLVAIVCCLCGHGQSSRIPQGNYIWEDVREKSAEGVSEFYDRSSIGPEELPLDGFVVDVGKEKLSVDEETIRKAEKMADEDLLNGLNRILKKNETLEDVFRSENVYEIP